MRLIYVSLFQGIRKVTIGIIVTSQEMSLLSISFHKNMLPYMTLFHKVSEYSILYVAGDFVLYGKNLKFEMLNSKKTMVQVYLHEIGVVSPEVDAAKTLRDNLEAELSNNDGKIWLIPSVDIHPGTGRHDVDLLMMGYLCDYYIDEIAGKSNIEIRNFFTSIEIKSHTAAGVSRKGTRLYVKYNGEDKDVTSQSEEQKESLKKFLAGPLQREAMKVPYVTNLIWLVGVTEDDFNHTIGLENSNVLSSDSSVEEFFKAIGRQSFLRNNGYVKAFDYDCTNDEIEFVADIFCAKSEGADSMSLRRINFLKQRILETDIVSKLMSQEPIIVLSGHAGTGKTVMLLRAANYLSQNGHKCLFLTYNTALIADLRRTMQILNRQGAVFEMESMHSFLIRLLSQAGIWRSGYDIANDFDYAVATLLQTKNSHPMSFDYEYVFVDEAQDWRLEEAQLLCHYCNTSHIVIADGIDQFMYSRQHMNWGRSSFPKLKKCLRQRAGLVSFAKIFASKLGVYWDVDPSLDIPGGKVIVTNDYSPDLHSELYKDVKEHGCTAYDMMLLAPNSMCTSGCFDPLKAYEAVGIKLFDGVNKKNRSKLYSSQNYQNEECRVYTYESCRGLEAWTTVCLRFDQLFTMPHPHDYKDIEYKAARDYMCALWSLMPLTRAVSTLVLCVEKGSCIDTLLKEIYDEYPDLIDYRVK